MASDRNSTKHFTHATRNSASYYALFHSVRQKIVPVPSNRLCSPGLLSIPFFFIVHIRLLTNCSMYITSLNIQGQFSAKKHLGEKLLLNEPKRIDPICTSIYRNTVHIDLNGTSIHRNTAHTYCTGTIIHCNTHGFTVLQTNVYK
jgi:hypothetical protein